jgi:Arc/MetJ-type ribon-helix-helix transcriptional regulator
MVSESQELVKKGEYSTMSDAIRAAINDFVESQFIPNHIRKMTIELPKGNVIGLEELVRSGDSISIDDAIRNAVREYLRRRVSEVIRSKNRE